jgi:hypothetical protein
MIDPFKLAYIKIEDDLVVLEAAASVLHLAFGFMIERGEDKTALAQSIWFTAKGLEAAVERIQMALGEEPTEPEPACAMHPEAPETNGEALQ